MEASTITVGRPETSSGASHDAPMSAFMSHFPTKQRNGAGKTRQHRCSICSQTFARAEHLTRHERSHRREKPFQCDFCSVRFARKDLIKRHVTRHHPEEAGNHQARVPPGSNGSPEQTTHDNAETRSQASNDNNTTIVDSPIWCAPDFVPLANWGPPTPSSAGIQNQLTDASQNCANSALDIFDLDSFVANMDYVNDPLDFQDTGILTDLMADPTLSGGKSVPFMEQEWNAAPRAAKGLASPHTSRESIRRGSFEISEAKRTDLIFETKKGHLDLSATIPSCLQLERYITACFDTLITIVPCIHIPTWKAEDADPCLLLAMAAMGAKYCHKHDLAAKIHQAAQSLMLTKIRTFEDGAREYPAWVLQALFFIMCFGTWSGQAKMARDALGMQSLLAEMFRAKGALSDVSSSQPSEGLHTKWEDWAAAETVIRTKYTVYQYFSLITLALNRPPAIHNSEIELPMPCPEREWTASSAREWEACRQDSAPRPMFPTSLDSLLNPSVASASLGGSFADHIMLHALLQQIWFCRQDRWSQCTTSHLANFSSILDKWEEAAVLASELSISPHSARAPIAYNSHALLRLARLYLCVDLGRVHNAIASHNVHTISQSMESQLEVGRSTIHTKAALLATKALRVPLRFGVTPNGGCASLQYFILSIECGLYLSKWLQALHQVPAIEWTDREKEVVSLAKSTLNELELPPDKAVRPLGAQIAYACSMILQGIGTWGLSPMLLSALTEFADHQTS